VESKGPPYGTASVVSARIEGFDSPWLHTKKYLDLLNMKIEQPPQIKKEKKETLENLDSFKNFLIEKMAFLPRKKLKEKPPAEIVDLYKEYLNQETNFENFKNLCGKFSEKEITEKSSEKYRDYLLNKLPFKIREKYLETLYEKNPNPDEFVEKLEENHQIRKENNLQMVLGFHCSNVDFGGFEGESFVDMSSEIENLGGEDLSGLTWYATDKHHLYGTKQKYLYLVEGSNYDEKTKEKIGRSHWVFTKRKLAIIEMIPLSGEVIGNLDLKFEKYNP